MLLVLALGVTLTGCKEDDPYDPNEKHTVYTGTFKFTVTGTYDDIPLNSAKTKEVTDFIFNFEKNNNLNVASYNNPKQWNKAEITAYLVDVGVNAAQTETIFKFLCDHKHAVFYTKVAGTSGNTNDVCKVLLK